MTTSSGSEPRFADVAANADAELRSLVDAAHSHGLFVILDIVFGNAFAYQCEPGNQPCDRTQVDALIYLYKVSGVVDVDSNIPQGTPAVLSAVEPAPIERMSASMVADAMGGRCLWRSETHPLRWRDLSTRSFDRSNHPIKWLGVIGDGCTHSWELCMLGVMGWSLGAPSLSNSRVAGGAGSLPVVGGELSAKG